MAVYVFSGLFILAGVLLLKSWLTTKRKIARSANWPSVVGQLGEFEVKERMRGTERHFVLRFTYEYAVNGKVYEGNHRNIRFSGDGYFKSEKAAWQRAEEIKNKSPFLVYYDLGNPAESVLFPEAPSAATKILIAGSVSVVMGVAILVSGRF